MKFVARCQKCAPVPVLGPGKPLGRQEARRLRLGCPCLGGWARGSACAPAPPLQPGHPGLFSCTPRCHLPLPVLVRDPYLEWLPRPVSACPSLPFSYFGPCLLLRAACLDFSALSPVPLPEASALPCLQLPLERCTSVPWGSWVSVAVGSSSGLRPSRDSALCP